MLYPISHTFVAIKGPTVVRWRTERARAKWPATPRCFSADRSVRCRTMSDAYGGAPKNSKEHIDILEHGDSTKKNPGKMMEHIGTW